MLLLRAPLGPGVRLSLFASQMCEMTCGGQKSHRGAIACPCAIASLQWPEGVQILSAIEQLFAVVLCRLPWLPSAVCSRRFQLYAFDEVLQGLLSTRSQAPGSAAVETFPDFCL